MKNKSLEEIIHQEKEEIFEKYKEKYKGIEERYKVNFDLEYEPSNQLKLIRFKIPKYHDLENIFIAYHFKLNKFLLNFYNVRKKYEYIKCDCLEDTFNKNYLPENIIKELEEKYSFRYVIKEIEKLSKNYLETISEINKVYKNTKKSNT